MSNESSVAAVSSNKKQTPSFIPLPYSEGTNRDAISDFFLMSWTDGPTTNTTHARGDDVA